MSDETTLEQRIADLEAVVGRIVLGVEMDDFVFPSALKRLTERVDNGQGHPEPPAPEPEPTATEVVVHMFEQIEKMRQTHGRVGGVYLYLGHDGDNACWLTDFEDNRIVHNCTGKGIVEAVQRTFDEWSNRGEPVEQAEDNEPFTVTCDNTQTEFPPVEQEVTWTMIPGDLRPVMEGLERIAEQLARMNKVHAGGLTLSGNTGERVTVGNEAELITSEAERLAGDPARGSGVAHDSGEHTVCAGNRVHWRGHEWLVMSLWPLFDVPHLSLVRHEYPNRRIMASAIASDVIFMSTD